MALSNDLISQFVKVTRSEKKTPTESTHFGTAVEYNGKMYVKLDGSDALTPVFTTTDMEPGERVSVLVKNHSATVTGNLSSPAARTDAVKEIAGKVTQVEVLIADRVTTEQLEAEIARIKYLETENITIKGTLTANKAEIDDLKAVDVTVNGLLTAAQADIESLSANKIDASIVEATYATIKELEATNADIYNLNATYGDFVILTTDKLEAVDATIESLDSKYATIDFANIGEAAVGKIFADYGIINELVSEEGYVTKQLVGVEIYGDLIKANSLVANKLVIQGEDGLFYQLNTDGMKVTAEEKKQDIYNSLNGSIITAKSVTADKVRVTDLVAFGATIGGFHITDDAIYSGVKESVNNTTRGSYLDKNGQFAIGDADNYLKYYKDTDGKHKFAIAADILMFGSSKKSVSQAIEGINVGGRNLIRNSTTMIFKDYYFDESYISASHDGNGNVIAIGMTAVHDGVGNVTIDGVNANNSDENVTLE